MGKFDELFNYLMEHMTAGGTSSVFGHPATGLEVGSTGGAVGVTDDRAFAYNDPRMVYGIGTMQKRPRIPNITATNRKSKKKK